MSPIHVIYNSGLRPKDEEIEAYKSRFNSATDYLVADFLNFFSLGAASLDAKAHKALVELVDVEKLRYEGVEVEDLDKLNPYEGSVLMMVNLLVLRVFL